MFCYLAESIEVTRRLTGSLSTGGEIVTSILARVVVPVETDAEIVPGRLQLDEDPTSE